jgi:hypothetical protein
MKVDRDNEKGDALERKATKVDVVAPCIAEHCILEFWI